VIKPFKDIYATIRYKETKLSVLRPEELKSELTVHSFCCCFLSFFSQHFFFLVQVLESMVTSFAKEHSVSKEALADIVERTTQGDISYVMQKYETEMRQPLKNALFGS